MAESMQTLIKEKIIECMKDGKARKVEEINIYLEEHGIKIEKSSTALRNALFNLKQENNCLVNIKRGVYIWKNDETKKNKDENEKIKYDLSDFITVQNFTKRENNLVVSIFEDGTVTLNKRLLECFPERRAQVKLKRDCSKMAIIKDGNEEIDFGKNGRIKNYDILDRLKRRKKKFPLYYVGNWDEQCGIWIGKISMDNPNKKSVKSSE